MGWSFIVSPAMFSNLVELAVIHFHHRVQNSSPERLQPSSMSRMRSDDVGSIFKEVFVQQGFDVFLWMVYSLARKRSEKMLKVN